MNPDNIFFSFLLGFDPLLPGSESVGGDMWMALRDTGLVLLAIGVVTVILLIIVRRSVVAKQERRSTRSYHKHHSSGSGTNKHDTSGGSKETSSHKRRKRRKRRDHRTRNPTLSETGGLPPAKQNKGGGSS
ncbi:MAG: hypothetical protein K9N48_05360 [Verrucomicrobia bacterium]|nr:hypothetical protein [Verrucomicrobiota bacterium]MCF7707660.1 hypothetical protein [Verrucomicrobiota bacterium]